MFNHSKGIIKASLLGLGSLLLLGGFDGKAQAQYRPSPAYNQQEVTDTDIVPDLINSGAIRNNSDISSTYYFTIEVPPEATNGLQAVLVSPKFNVGDDLFAVKESKAFLGDDINTGTTIPLVAVGGNQQSDPNDIMVVFTEPVAPGNTVTVALEVEENPSYPGIYQFGVTAYPDSVVIPPLYLGTARIRIYGSN